METQGLATRICRNHIGVWGLDDGSHVIWGKRSFQMCLNSGLLAEEIILDYPGES